MKKLLIAGGVGVVGFIGLQLFPAGKLGVHVEDIGTNPPERFDMGAPPDVAAIMKRACFDCHTNETKWPLYARLAPGSWLMARDVHNGRNHLNFSSWADADEEERQSDKENAWEHIESGEMPPWFYVYPLHLSAKLSAADKATLKGWLLKDSGDKKAADDEVAEADKKDDKKNDKKGDDKADEKPAEAKDSAAGDGKAGKADDKAKTDQGAARKSGDGDAKAADKGAKHGKAVAKKK